MLKIQWEAFSEKTFRKWFTIGDDTLLHRLLQHAFFCWAELTGWKTRDKTRISLLDQDQSPSLARATSRRVILSVWHKRPPPTPFSHAPCFLTATVGIDLLRDGQNFQCTIKTDDPDDDDDADDDHWHRFVKPTKDVSTDRVPFWQMNRD